LDEMKEFMNHLLCLHRRFTVASFGVCLLLLIVSGSLRAQDVKPSISEALKSGDTAAAITLLNKDIELDKSFDANYHLLGLIYYNRGQYQKAAEQLSLAVEKKGKNWDAQYHLGKSYIQLGDLDKAEKIMDDGRKKAKEFKDEFENGYGLVMMARKKYQEADLAFRQAQIIDSTVAEYHINLGDANFYSGVPSLAIASYEKALLIDTASSEVYYHWAEACLETKDYNCALEKLRQVLTKDSTYAPAWRRAGEIYFKAALSSKTREDRVNRYKETIGSYKRYLELSQVPADSVNVRPYFELAMAYNNLSGYDDAATYFENVLAIPYEPRDIYFNYAKALMGKKQYDSASVMIQKHLDWVKTQPETYNSAVTPGELYAMLGDGFYYSDPKDYGNAITYYLKALEISPDNKRAVQNIAVAYHTLKNYPKALEYYDKRIAQGLDTSSIGVYKNAGYTALSIAGGSGADTDFDLDAGEDGIDPVAVTETGQIDPNKNYHQVAVDYLTTYLAEKPDDAKATLLVANTYLYQLQDCQSGVTWFEKLSALEPGNCDAAKALGYAYFAGDCTKNYGKALGYLTDAYNCQVKGGKPCGDLNIILWMAQAYHLRAADKVAEKADANNDFKNAFEWYGKVLQCSPNNADAKKGQDDTKFEFN